MSTRVPGGAAGTIAKAISAYDMIERGSFRPATRVTVDMLRCAQAQFIQEPG